MKTIAAKRLSSPFIGLFHNEIIDLLLARISRIHTGRKNPKPIFDFTAGIDTNALVKAYQVSTGYHEIFGGASPNDFIPIGGLPKEHIFERLKACKKVKHGPMET